MLINELRHYLVLKQTRSLHLRIVHLALVATGRHLPLHHVLRRRDPCLNYIRILRAVVNFMGRTYLLSADLGQDLLVHKAR